MDSREVFMKKRILFVRNFCSYCAMYLEFIERLNTLLPIEKRIEVIDCSVWQDTGISNNFLISLFEKNIDGFPCLFFEGQRLSGANTREELEAYLKVRLMKDFNYLPEMHNELERPIYFNKDCRFKKTIFGRRIVCQ